MDQIYDDLKRTLVKRGLASNNDVNDKVFYKEDELHVILEHTGSKSELTENIRKDLIKVSNGFEFKLILNGKEKTIIYPQLKDKIKEFNYQRIYKDSFIIATIITGFYICVMTILVSLINQEPETIKGISDKLLDVSALISSFVITYLTSKVLTVRQEKLNRVEKIKELSNKLTEFRRICHVVLESWQFWQPSAAAHAHGKNVAKKITFNDLQYLNVYDRRWDEIHNMMKYETYGEIKPKFVLQLATLCKSKDRYIHNRLFLGMSFLANYIYSLKELEEWRFLPDNNMFWYVFENEWQDYERSFNFQISDHDKTRITKCAGRLDNSLVNKNFSKELLVSASQIAENEIIPELTRLVKKNEAKQSFLIKYLLICFSGVFVFGVLLQVILGLFLSSLVISYISIIAVTAIVIHILISMPAILKSEITFHPKYDYD
ncbi:hypothetical protein SAMN04487898_105203 [Pedobacter sp. ok626]|uniref:hypothetical protein n=1 Tax=Pedobacter sp. ok626 TaxID=1761882 RepID=UPI00087FE4A6|nr:hypothetical protein [Pedobacter sp. ok626]SDJ98028.1 hypothetical protein SAMN04487898_105203 [Pedobacter sp. ok626]